ncbi:MAG: alpha/beta fold hydrolase [Flavobacteriaceae bacterium]
MLRRILFYLFLIPFIGCSAEQSQTNKDYQLFTVPYNRDNPDKSKTIAIAYKVIPALKQSGKPPIVFLQGGPGGSSLFWSSYWLNNPLREEHDIILFDQRYTGFSQSYCSWASESLLELARKDMSLQEEVSAIKEIAKRCRKEFIDNGIDIKTISTTENVEDLEALRKEIKADKMILLGGSYGTRLGLKYLQKYQENVSASILTGAFPPSVSLHNNLMENFESSLKYLVNLCENDENCNSKYSDLTAVHSANIASLQKSPFKVNFNNRDFYLNTQDYLLILQQMLYSKQTAQLIPKYIYSIQNKNQETIRIGISNTINAISGLNPGAFWGYLTNEPKEQIMTHKLYSKNRSSGFSFFIPNSDIFKSWGGIYNNDSIEFLKHIKTPTLMVNGNLDPITPTKDARLIVENMPNSQLLEFPFDGHGVFNNCFFNSVLKFLNNEEMDTKCSKNSPINFD